MSSFNDQIVRGHIPPVRTHDAFMHFLSNHANHEYLGHTGTAKNMCIGYSKARFDYIINLEDISSFANVARLVPAYGALIETGWEKCTNGDPRLYMPGSVSLHKNNDSDMKYQLCNKAAISKVCNIYSEDYKIYARIGHPFKCSCESKVQA